MLSAEPLKKAYRNLLPFYVAAVALISPLRFAYSFLKKYHAVPVWEDLVGNICVLTFEFMYAVIRSLLFGLLFYFVYGLGAAGLVMSLLDFEDDTIDTIARWAFYTPATVLFVVQAVLIVGDSGSQILSTKLTNSRFDVFPRWLEIVIGGLALVPSYIFLFRRVRRWLRATFPSDRKDVKDLLA